MVCIMVRSMRVWSANVLYAVDLQATPLEVGCTVYAATLVLVSISLYL